MSWLCSKVLFEHGYAGPHEQLVGAAALRFCSTAMADRELDKDSRPVCCRSRQAQSPRGLLFGAVRNKELGNVTGSFAHGMVRL